MPLHEKPGQDDLGVLFHRASRLLARAYHREDRGSHAQEHILALLLAHSPMTQGELLDVLDVRSSSLSELLSKLEKSGFVERKRNEQDRRGFVVSITKAGRAAFEQQKKEGHEAREGLFACLSPDEIQSLTAVLQKLITSLHDQDEALCKRRGGCGEKYGHHGCRRHHCGQRDHE